MQRNLPIANGSFLEAQFQFFADPSAVIHHGQYRARGGRLTVAQADSYHRPAAIAELNWIVEASPHAGATDIKLRVQGEPSMYENTG